MKILILSDIQDHGKKCAEGLLNMGHEIIYVFPKGMVTKGVVLNKKINIIELPYGGSLNYILNWLPLRKLCTKIKPDIVHVHYATGFGLLATLAAIHPFVISCYGSDIFEFPHKNKFNFFLLRHILKKADGLQSTSKIMSDEIKSIIKDKNKPIDIIPFGIDLQRFKSIKHNKKNNRPTVGFIKSLNPIYDVPLLIQAFSIAYNKLETKPLLIIIGDGPLMGELKKLVFSLNIKEAVTFVGRISNEEVPEMLRSFDVFVNSSKEESFGVNILEAMACEVPVIATNCLGPNEVLENGKCGIILRDRNPESMADAMIELFNNKELREKYIRNARCRVVDCYDWDNNVKTLQQSLENVTNKYKLKK